MKPKVTFSLSAVLALMLLSAVVPANVVLAAGITDNLAGRPVSGNAMDTIGGCQGIAYGRVNNQHVLFYPIHCMNGANNLWGKIATGDSGARIGVWGPNPAALGVGDTRDLGYLVLDAGAHPATWNQVYKGSAGFWTITATPLTSLNCANIGSKIGATGNQNWQQTSSTTLTPRQGTFLFVYQPGPFCMLEINLFPHVGVRDSGSPLVLSTNTNTVVGFATSTDPNGGKMLFSNLAEGVATWNSYWLSHGVAGAALCITSAC